MCCIVFRHCSFSDSTHVCSLLSHPVLPTLVLCSDPSLHIYIHTYIHTLIDRQSVVQANTSARNSKLRYYIGILLAILFFGGFFVKSYLEERFFERDTKRLLAYYKHVLPGSLADGDLNNARYLVWKYRGKREKLWKRLETKYGEVVRHAHEWEGYDEENKEDEEEEVEEQNLDDDDDDGTDDKEEQPDL